MGQSHDENFENIVAGYSVKNGLNSDMICRRPLGHVRMMERNRFELGDTSLQEFIDWIWGTREKREK